MLKDRHPVVRRRNSQRWNPHFDLEKMMGTLMEMRARVLRKVMQEQKKEQAMAATAKV